MDRYLCLTCPVLSFFFIASLGTQVQKCHVWHFTYWGSWRFRGEGQVYGGWDGKSPASFPGKHFPSASEFHEITAAHQSALSLSDRWFDFLFPSMDCWQETCKKTKRKHLVTDNWFQLYHLCQPAKRLRLSACFVFSVQDLLQLQYEGVAVMKMFDKAKVNVNLLIFLLNKKFYGKWKQQECDGKIPVVPCLGKKKFILKTSHGVRLFLFCFGPPPNHLLII